MILTGAKTLTLELDGAAGTTEPTAFVQFKDKSLVTGLVDYGNKETQTTGATAVTVCAAPGAGSAVEREVELIMIYNTSTTATNLFTVKITGGTTDPMGVFEATLATLETAVYTPSTGWRCYKATGALKTTT